MVVVQTGDFIDILLQYVDVGMIQTVAEKKLSIVTSPHRTKRINRRADRRTAMPPHSSDVV